MAKVPYTVNLDDYVCSELSRIRTMVQTLDFSSLPATVERIQFHGTRMENAIERFHNIEWRIREILEGNLTSDEKIEAIRAHMKRGS